MAELTAAATVRAADRLVHDMGSTWMISPETAARSAEYGYAKPLAFYFAGRGGVLGDVDADVVYAAMGWFEPHLVRAMWEEGQPVHGSREAAKLYGQACAAWGDDHFADFAGATRMQQLGDRVIAAAEGSGLPLFAGWRAEPRAKDGPGRLMQVIHTLRELRGGLHLSATTAAGLSPLEAILTNEGPGQATFFGWQDEFPDCDELKPRHDVAEGATNDLCAAVYERALSPAERGEFAELTVQGAALLPPLG